MFQAGRKRIDLEPRRRHRNLPVGPAPGRRHLQRRDRALRLRLRNHRSAAPGRLRCCALQPAPQQRGGADQRDDARKNAGQAHVIPLLIARTLSDDRGAFKPCRRYQRGDDNDLMWALWRIMGEHHYFEFIAIVDRHHAPAHRYLPHRRNFGSCRRRRPRPAAASARRHAVFACAVQRAGRATLHAVVLQRVQ